MERDDPLRSFRYRLEVDGVIRAAFSELSVSGPGNDRLAVTASRTAKASGDHGNVTLQWGLSDSSELSKWHRSASDETAPLADKRRRVVIHVEDEAGNDKARFEIAHAWPVKLEGPELNGRGNEVAIETLELAHDGIRRIP